MSRKLTLKLSNLYLDLKNPRYEEQRSQNEALNTIASDQKEKLLFLLRDIIKNGLNPSDIPIVMPDKDRVNGYIVLEGNRRIAALKLFKKPAILKSTVMRQKYSKLNEKHKDDIVKSIECLVVDTRDAANLWIERKHEGEMNGAGTVKWNSEQSSRFRANNNGKDTRVLQLIDFMKAAMADDYEFAEQLSNTKVTNLERLLSTPAVCTELGLDYDHGEYSSTYEWSEVMKGLRAVVRRLSDNHFSVNDIYHKKDRVDFIKAIPREELPDKTRTVTVPWKLKDFNAENKPAQVDNAEGKDIEDSKQEDTQKKAETQAQQERPTSRDTFLPEDFILAIPNDRVNRIYSELKLLSHNTMTNTCAVMLRVFLELSADCYLETFGLLKEGVLSGSRNGDLKSKINLVIKHLCDKKYLDDAKAKGIRDELNANQGTYSVDTLNAYVHNLDFNPKPENLMIAWDNIKPFVMAMWKAISEKGNE